MRQGCDQQPGAVHYHCSASGADKRGLGEADLRACTLCAPLQLPHMQVKRGAVQQERQCPANSVTAGLATWVKCHAVGQEASSWRCLLR